MVGTLTGLQWGIYDAYKVSVGLPTTGSVEVSVTGSTRGFGTGFMAGTGLSATASLQALLTSLRVLCAICRRSEECILHRTSERDALLALTSLGREPVTRLI
jgi:hypothetical protein